MDLALTADASRTLLVSAIASGQGKTTVTAALARRLIRAGRRVRVFKTGADFLDPAMLAHACGAPVQTLDLWMVGEPRCQALLAHAAREADVVLIEGAMGIATFRRRFLAQIEKLFVQVLVLAREMKCLKLGNISLDGTKIAANASKHKALSWEHANKIEAQLREEVQLLLKLAEESDTRAVNDGLDVPAEIARREKRLAAIAQAKTKIEERARERHAVEQQDYEAKCAKRQGQREAGKKPRGPDPEPPSSGPKAGDQVNLTDEESRIMPGSSGGFGQSYNAQAAVDTETMMVVVSNVSQAPNDKREIAPILDKVQALPEELGQVLTLLADTGYFSAANVNACEARGIEPMLAMKRESHHIPVLERFAADAPVPETDDPVVRMAHRLGTRKGRALYGLRKQTVEPVFGIIKRVMGWSQMSMRGLDKARGEWSLVTMAWNIKRLHVLQAA